MMAMVRMTMMMMMMSTRINHNNAFSDSFSASIISEFFQWRYSKPKIRTLCSTGHLLSRCKSVYDHLLWSLLQVVTVHRLEHPVIIVIIQHEHDQHHDQHHGQHNGQHHGQHYNWREHDQHHGQHELDIKIATSCNFCKSWSCNPHPNANIVITISIIIVIIIIIIIII